MSPFYTDSTTNIANNSEQLAVPIAGPFSAEQFDESKVKSLHSSIHSCSDQKSHQLDDTVDTPVCTSAAKSIALHPSMSHLILAGEAALFGAATATADLIKDALRCPGATQPSDAAAAWSAAFRANTTAAAAAVTPVGAYVLRSHVFRETEV